MTLTVQHFFDSRTSTLTYVVHTQGQKECVVIDPVLDFDLEKMKIFTESADQLIQYLEQHGLVPRYILETHVHADHMTASAYLKSKYHEAKVVIGHHVDRVQDVFNLMLRLNPKARPESFDLLVKEGDVLEVGKLQVEVIETPGHTPACVTYKIGSMLFTGDFLFMPDSGTGRCDFPLGSAAQLYESVHKIFKQPPETKIYVGHDYQPGGRALMFETTVGEQRQKNIHLRDGVSEREYIDFRETRDKSLSAPKLLIPSLQVNLRAGHFMFPEGAEKPFLQFPLEMADSLAEVVR